jgi:hypothetical protein
MIVDDVWREPDLGPFLQGGPNTTRLITTRIDNVLPTRCKTARRCLQAGCRSCRTPWRVALLLKLVNGFLRDRVVKSGQSLAPAIAGVTPRYLWEDRRISGRPAGAAKSSATANASQVVPNGVTVLSGSKKHHRLIQWISCV